MKLYNGDTISPKFISIQLTKNKVFQFQLEFDKFNENPFELTCEYVVKRDHAGFNFMFSIYKLFWFCLGIHDRRHWDYENNAWEEPGDCKYEKWEEPNHIDD